MKSPKFLMAVIAIGAYSSLASAQSIVHRWDMSDTNDSIGSANGTLGTGATLLDGELLPANGANPSGGNGNGLVLPTTAVAGLSGAFSIESWYTWDGTGGYQTVFSFSNNTTSDFLIAVARRGGDGVNQSTDFTHNGQDLIEGPTFAAGVIGQAVTTYDGAGTARLYLNGELVAINPDVDSTFDLSSYTQIGIGGSSPWPDDSLHGSISDFRIYEGLLSDDQVGELFGFGADATNEQIFAAVPEPGVVLLGGVAAMFFLRRKRRA